MSETCSEKIWNGWGRNHYRCENKAKVERDGKPYCGVHDPEKRKKKDAERKAEWDRQSAIENRKWAILKACEGLTVEEVKAAFDAAQRVSDQPK